MMKRGIYYNSKKFRTEVWQEGHLVGWMSERMRLQMHESEKPNWILTSRKGKGHENRCPHACAE